MWCKWYDIMFVQWIQAVIIHLLGNISSTRYHHRHHLHCRRQSNRLHQTRTDSFIGFVVMSLSYFFWLVHDPNIQLFSSHTAHFMCYRKIHISNWTHRFFPALLIAMVVFEDWLQIGLAANRRFAPPIRHTLSNSLIHYNNNVTFRLEKWKYVVVCSTTRITRMCDHSQNKYV